MPNATARVRGVAIGLQLTSLVLTGQGDVPLHKLDGETSDWDRAVGEFRIKLRDPSSSLQGRCSLLTAQCSLLTEVC